MGQKQITESAIYTLDRIPKIHVQLSTILENDKVPN